MAGCVRSAQRQAANANSLSDSVRSGKSHLLLHLAFMR